MPRSGSVFADHAKPVPRTLEVREGPSHIKLKADAKSNHKHHARQ